LSGKAAPPKPQPQEKPAPVGFLPLGRKLHWKTLNDRAISNTVWEHLFEDEEEASAAAAAAGQDAGFNDMVRVFAAPTQDALAGAPGNAGGSGGSASSSVASSPNTQAVNIPIVTLIDPKRAQNVGVVLARLPLNDLTPAILNLRTSMNNFNVTVEILDRLKSILPTDEEVMAFSSCPEDANLRDIERKLRPLYLIKRVHQRVRIMGVQIQLETIVTHTHAEISILRRAAQELKDSQLLRRILRLVLQLGNFVNFGTSDVNHIRGFSIDSLQKLSEFRAQSDSSISSLHFLAAKVLTDSTTQPLANVAQELPSLGLACRVSVESVVTAINTLKGDSVVVNTELSPSNCAGYDKEEVEKLHALGFRLTEKLNSLNEEWQVAESKLVEIRRFFGEDPKKCTVEDFFLAIRSFIDSFTLTCNDLSKHPKKVHRILSRNV
jgi:formin 2